MSSAFMLAAKCTIEGGTANAEMPGNGGDRLAAIAEGPRNDQHVVVYDGRATATATLNLDGIEITVRVISELGPGAGLTI